MKKLFLAIAIFLSATAYAQDSVMVTVSVQARDLEYIASFIFNDNEREELYDTLKSKFRVATPPTTMVVVPITASSKDWLYVYSRLNSDAIAIKANCASRLTTLLLALNDTYITSVIEAAAIQETNRFQAVRIFGRSKLRKTN